MEEKKFNLQKFDLMLDTEWVGRNFVFLDEVDSTNTYLLNSKSIKTNGTVVYAEKQSEGKGRLDRTWSSAKGLNLTFSILLNSGKLIKKINYINLGASLVIAQTIENIFLMKTELKWPNDVLVNKKKISGILLESLSSGKKLTRVVVGIGMNINQAVFHGEFKIEPTSIKMESGNYGDRERTLADLLNRMEQMIARIETNPGGILDDWRERCRMIGDEIAIRQHDKTIYGIFDDIDENGNLLLKSNGKILPVNFGDVTLV